MKGSIPSRIERALWSGGLVALVGLSGVGYWLGSRPVVTGTSSTTGVEVVRPALGDAATVYRGRVAALEEQLAQDSSSQSALLELGRLRLAAHNSAGAAVLLERLTERAPDHAEAWLELGRAYGALRGWDKAEMAMRKVLHVRPGHETALYNLGAIAANQGRRSEAEGIWGSLLAGGGDPALRDRARESLNTLHGLDGTP